MYLFNFQVQLFFQSILTIIQVLSSPLNHLFTSRGTFNYCFLENVSNIPNNFRNDTVNNNDSATARNLIIDHFKCKFLGGYGEKVLSFLKESGKFMIGKDT